MLVLTRRVGETLMIGDDITVTVLGVKGNQVRLGTTAPKNVEVHRQEIYWRAYPERAPWADAVRSAQAAQRETTTEAPLSSFSGSKTSRL